VKFFVEEGERLSATRPYRGGGTFGMLGHSGRRGEKKKLSGVFKAGRP